MGSNGVSKRLPGKGEPRLSELLVPCTCGELVQGIWEGDPFLVSCPIDQYSRVRVTLGVGIGAGGSISPDSRSGSPHWEAGRLVPCELGIGESAETGTATVASSKAWRAAEVTLALLGLEGEPFDLRVECPLPPSRGFGTSTADVVGAICAASAAAGRFLSADEVARIAVSIEPSDGTMFYGLAAFPHRSAGWRKPLGAAPPLWIAVLEFRGAVDTLEFNAGLDISRLSRLEPEHGRALELLRRGVAEGQWDLIGEAATASARANQALLPKAELERVVSLCDEAGGLGVCAAHSGTLLGVLFAPEDQSRATRLLSQASTRLMGLERCWLTRLVDGGPRFVSSAS